MKGSDMAHQVQFSLSERPDGSGMPLYTQLYSLFVKRLESGDWQQGSQIPTLDDLMVEYGVSRATVREAMARLEREGIVSRSRGRGTHVLRDLSKDRWLLLPNTWDELVHHIETLEADVTEVRRSFVQLPPLGLRGIAAAEYWQAQRVNRLGPGGAPYSLATVSLARDIYDTDPDTYGGKSILPVLARDPRVTIAAAHQALTISTADLEAAHHLGLEVGVPVAQVRREALDPAGRLIYLADIVYPARHLRIDSQLI